MLDISNYMRLGGNNRWQYGLFLKTSIKSDVIDKVGYKESLKIWNNMFKYNILT